MLEELVKSRRLYGYNTDTEDNVFGARGIVIADSEEEVKRKVIDAYTKHGCSENEFDNLNVWKITNGWFKDAPDVLEI